MERSGTTLLSAMISGHSRVCRSVPPFVANLFQTWPDGAASLEQLERFLDDLYGRTRFKNSLVSRDALRAHLTPRVPLSFRDLAAEAATAHSARAGKPEFLYWTDRTPWFVPMLHAHKAQLDRTLGEYRVLAIVRDGRAVLSSALRAQATRGFGFRTDVFYLAARWRQAATLGTLFTGGGRFFQVRYEDLVTRPADTLRLTCQFLDLAYEPGMLDYQQLELAAPIHRLLAAPPRPDRAEAWHAEADPHLLRIFDWLAREELRRNGYLPLPPALRRSVVAAGWETASYWLQTRARHRLRWLREGAHTGT